MMGLLSHLALRLLRWLLHIRPLRPDSLYALVDGHGEGGRSRIPSRGTSVIRNPALSRARWQLERNRFVVKAIVRKVPVVWRGGKWTV